ncbi:hypothetical protein ACH5RR_001328 [Cinchona calisaya]|uniref:Uncharacterized protein n=1 Tax=Cinchona calisaya TaxID=153742 RepID=A0ABD3B326_9GENT
MPLHSRPLHHNITAIISSVYSHDLSIFYQFRGCPLIYLTSPAKPISRFSLYNNGFRSIFHSTKPTVGFLCLVEYEDKSNDEEEDTSDYAQLKQKLDRIGLNYYDSCTPGQYHLLFCPKRWTINTEESVLSYHPK